MVTNIFSSGTLIKSSEVNENFAEVEADIATNTTNITTSTGSTAALSAQNYFETLKHSGDVDNEDYLIADIFTNTNGVKDTINTGVSSAYYNTSNDLYSLTPSNVPFSGTTLYSGAGWSNIDNLFDGNDNTSASTSTLNNYVGKTFSSQYVSTVRLLVSGSTYGSNCKIEYYNGSSWIDFTGTISYDAGPTKTEFLYFLGFNIQGIRVTHGPGGNGNVSNFWSLDYVTYNTSPQDVETNNLIALNGTEKGIVVYDKSSKPTGTNIKVDVVGTSTLSNQNCREYIDISSFGVGNLSLDFNLSTTNTSETPLLYGYGISIIK